MENLKRILKKSGWVSTLESMLFAILGIILVCRPEGTVKIITGLIGTIFIVIGILKIINYFSSKGINDFFNYDLVYGLTSIVIGFVAIFYLNIIASIFRIIIGIWIVYTSFVRINASIQIKRVGSEVWLYSLILALIMFACGVYVIINSNAIIVSIGIIMIVYAVIDIIEHIIFMKNVDKIL